MTPAFFNLFSRSEPIVFNRSNPCCKYLERKFFNCAGIFAFILPKTVFVSSFNFFILSDMNELTEFDKFDVKFEIVEPNPVLSIIDDTPVKNPDFPDVVSFTILSKFDRALLIGFAIFQYLL